MNLCISQLKWRQHPKVQRSPLGSFKSSLQGENARLTEAVKQKNHEIARLQDECCQLKEQLVAAKGTIGRLDLEKASLSCQLAAERDRTAPFTVERFKDSNEDMVFYTGLPSYKHFKKTSGVLEPR